MRSLNPDEAALWARVTATIAPLDRQKNPQQLLETPSNILARESLKKLSSVRAERSARRPSDHASATLDGGWDRRLRGGTVDPDATLDLHGLTLDQAWNAIDRGLDQAIARGHRLVLLITGHHRPGAPPVERGKIRAAVHDWLAASRHAAAIAAVRGAHSRHGGGGSLYIILRRR